MNHFCNINLDKLFWFKVFLFITTVTMIVWFFYNAGNPETMISGYELSVVM